MRTDTFKDMIEWKCKIDAKQMNTQLSHIEIVMSDTEL